MGHIGALNTHTDGVFNHFLLFIHRGIYFYIYMWGKKENTYIYGGINVFLIYMIGIIMFLHEGIIYILYFMVWIRDYLLIL